MSSTDVSLWTLDNHSNFPVWQTAQIYKYRQAFVLILFFPPYHSISLRLFHTLIHRHTHTRSHSHCLIYLVTSDLGWAELDGLLALLLLRQIHLKHNLVDISVYACVHVYKCVCMP